MATGLDVTIPAGGGAPETPAFAILPEGAKRGMVVIHEIFGRRPEIDRVVERFARAGYAAVAPDLFARGRFACLKDVFLQASTTGEGVSVTQGRNARQWLCDKTGIPPERVGLIGFCFGGGYALVAGSGWGAVSTNYGAVPKASAMKNLGRVIGCYGSRDKAMKASPGRLTARLATLGHEAPEIHVLDAGHSFLTDGKLPLVSRLLFPLALGDYPEARDEGWKRILDFMDRRLGA